MIFYFDAQGNLKGGSKERVYQGSNRANQIYFVAPFAKGNVIKVAFMLPSGEETSRYQLNIVTNGDTADLFAKDGSECNVWCAEIPFVVTKEHGAVLAQFYVYGSENQIIATASVSFLVERGVKNISQEENLSYQEFIEKVKTLIRKDEDLEKLFINEIVSKTTPQNEGTSILSINVSDEPSVKEVDRGKAVNSICHMEDKFVLGYANYQGATYGYVFGRVYPSFNLTSGSYNLSKLTIDNKHRIYAFGDGLFFSVDGQTYINCLIDDLPANGEFFESPVAIGNTVICSGDGGTGIIYSEDGKNFYTVEGFKNVKNVKTFAINGRFYITSATEDFGVYYSENGKDFINTTIDKGAYQEMIYASSGICFACGKSGILKSYTGLDFIETEIANPSRNMIEMQDCMIAFSTTDGSVFKSDEVGAICLRANIEGVVLATTKSDDGFVCITSEGRIYFSANGDSFELITTITSAIDVAFFNGKYYVLTDNDIYCGKGLDNLAVLGTYGRFCKFIIDKNMLFAVGDSGVVCISNFSENEQFISVSKENESNAIPLRDDEGNLRSNTLYGYKKEETACVTQGDIRAIAGDCVCLNGGNSAGLMISIDLKRIKQSACVKIALGEEIFYLYEEKSTENEKIFQRFDGSIIKTITLSTINGAWELTERHVSLEPFEILVSQTTEPHITNEQFLEILEAYKHREVLICWGVSAQCKALVYFAKDDIVEKCIKFSKGEMHYIATRKYVNGAHVVDVVFFACQRRLESGVNLKTINDTSLLGSGNIETYPVGSIYLSVSTSFSPAEAFGGSWELVQEGLALVSASGIDSSESVGVYATNARGGAETATLTLTSANIPRHQHIIAVPTEEGALTIPKGELLASGSVISTSDEYVGKYNPVGTTYVGDTEISTFNIDTVSPYIAVNVWWRVE